MIIWKNIITKKWSHI